MYIKVISVNLCKLFTAILLQTHMIFFIVTVLNVNTKISGKVMAVLEAICLVFVGFLRLVNDLPVLNERKIRMTGNI